MNQLTTLDELLERPAVEQATGLKRSTIYEKMDEGEFPRPIKVGKRAVRWLSSEIRAWQQDQIAKRESTIVERTARLARHREREIA